MPNWSIWRVFLGKLQLAVKQCYQTGQLLIRQMLRKNAKIENRDTFGDFQTQWLGDNDSSNHHPDLSKEGD